MVRLKEVELMQIYPDEKDFNSTMVRLKATTDSVITLSPPIFQFHYGSVKSFCGANNSLNEAVFQFHYGSVKRLLEMFGRLYTVEFQFHYGSVKSLRGYHLY